MAKHSVTFAYLSIGHIILQGSHDFCLYVLFVTVTGLAVLILIQFPARWFRCSCNLCKYTWSTATIINGCFPLLLTFKSSLTVENNRDQPVTRQCVGYNYCWVFKIDALYTSNITSFFPLIQALNKLGRLVKLL